MLDDDRNSRAFPWEETLLARLELARRRLDHERAEAPVRCSELLALPPADQAGRATADPRFQTWGVCEELLRQSVELEEDDPETAGHLAALALAAAPALGGEHDPSLVRDLEARAWACFGAAQLRVGDVSAAESALREGALRLADGTGDLLVDARLLEFEAAVREAQGGLRAAAGLLRQAEARYREIGETTRANRAGSTRQRLLRELLTTPEFPPLLPD
jgi:hypothetical protein